MHRNLFDIQIERFIDPLSIKISDKNFFENRKNILYLPYVDVGKDMIFQACSQCEFL